MNHNVKNFDQTYVEIKYGLFYYINNLSINNYMYLLAPICSRVILRTIMSNFISYISRFIHLSAVRIERITLDDKETGRVPVQLMM